MKKRIISLILCGLMLVNVPAVFAQGEDTTVSENTVQFQGEEFDRSELSQETIAWSFRGGAVKCQLCTG